MVPPALGDREGGYCPCLRSYGHEVMASKEKETREVCGIYRSQVKSNAIESDRGGIIVFQYNRHTPTPDL